MESNYWAQVGKAIGDKSAVKHILRLYLDSFMINIMLDLSPEEAVSIILNELNSASVKVMNNFPQYQDEVQKVYDMTMQDEDVLLFAIDIIDTVSGEDVYAAAAKKVRSSKDYLSRFCKERDRIHKQFSEEARGG